MNGLFGKLVPIGLMWFTMTSEAAGPIGWDITNLVLAKDGSIYAGYESGVLMCADRGER